MAYDIYGERLLPGHCEVHPWVHVEYPCPVCIREAKERRQRKRQPEPGPPGPEVRMELSICQVSCPQCGSQSFCENWKPVECPWCGHSLGDYTDADLRAEPRSVTVSIDRLTGQAVIIT
ncbi:MAG: hypothetical protein K6T65_13065 [Peptococcaceae bacterium]|nr:hypothetical protein [Peptococcaceae bacterium]